MKDPPTRAGILESEPVAGLIAAGCPKGRTSGASSHPVPHHVEHENVVTIDPSGAHPAHTGYGVAIGGTIGSLEGSAIARVENARSAVAPAARGVTAPGPRAVILEGVRLHAVDEEQCVALVLEASMVGRGGWIVTPNLDHLRRLLGDASMRAYYRRADLSVADGMPLVWACRLQNTPLPGRIAGSDLIWSLSRGAAAHGLSVFFLGGDPGTAQDTANALSARFTNLHIAGVFCPAPGFEDRKGEIADLTALLVATGPDVVFVALGSPKQEALIERLRPHLPKAWWLGVGISFSFVAGRVQRAPVWMRRIGFEWLHRLIQEPGRLARRYLRDGLPFAAALLARSTGRGLRARLLRRRLSGGTDAGVDERLA